MRVFCPAFLLILTLQWSTAVGWIGSAVPSSGFPPQVGGKFASETIKLATGTTTTPSLSHSTIFVLRSSRKNDIDSTTTTRTLFQRLRSSLSIATRNPIQYLLKTRKFFARRLRLRFNRTMTANASEAVLDPPLASSSPTMAQEDNDHTASAFPQGPRWAIAHPSIDLSGTWKPVITAQFQKDYDQYLTNCGAHFVFRKVCLKFCSATREVIDQVENGRIVHLHGKSPAGGWKRSLIASGADTASADYQAVHAEFLDPDQELVKVEAWWEDEGRIHKSVLREKPGVAGGVFETLRYLTQKDETEEMVLVTESTFYPSLEHPSSQFKPAFIRWIYEKE